MTTTITFDTSNASPLARDADIVVTVASDSAVNISIDISLAMDDVIDEAVCPPQAFGEIGIASSLYDVDSVDNGGGSFTYTISRVDGWPCDPAHFTTVSVFVIEPTGDITTDDIVYEMADSIPAVTQVTSNASDLTGSTPVEFEIDNAAAIKSVRIVAVWGESVDLVSAVTVIKDLLCWEGAPVAGSHSSGSGFCTTVWTLDGDTWGVQFGPGGPPYGWQQQPTQNKILIHFYITTLDGIEREATITNDPDGYAGVFTVEDTDAFGGTDGGNAPVITWITTPGQAQRGQAAISFSVTDEELRMLIVSARFESRGIEEVIYRNGRFAELYRNSTAVVDGDTTTFVVSRYSGWVADMLIQVDPVDVGGQSA